MEAEVGVIGLGISSLLLLRLLERDGIDYRIISNQAFGVWGVAKRQNLNWDLVSTLKSTAFRHWSLEHKDDGRFPFYSAKTYHARLK